METLDDLVKKSGCVFTPGTCDEGWTFGEHFNPQCVTLSLVLLRKGARAVLFSGDAPLQERARGMFEQQAKPGERFSLAFQEMPPPGTLKVTRHFGT